MADAIVRLGYLTVAQFNANPTLVLEAGQHVHLVDGADEYVDAYVIGDGTTQLQNLDWKGVKGVVTVTGSGVDNTDPMNPVISATGTTPTEEIFTNQDGSAPIELSTTPAYVMVFNGSGQKLTNTVDYTIAADEITFLNTFESTNIIVTKYQ